MAEADKKKVEVNEEILSDMSGMAAVEQEEFVAEDEDYVDEAGLISSSGELIRTHYHKPGQPDFHAFKVNHPTKIEQIGLTRTQNDIYLDKLKPNDVLGELNNWHAKRYANYKRVSAYDAKKARPTEYALKHQPMHAEGYSKGITFQTRHGIFNTHSMCFYADSDVNMVTLGSGLRVKLKDALRLYQGGDDVKIRAYAGRVDPIIAFHDNGIKEVWRVTLEDGTVFEVTPDHKFPIYNDETAKKGGRDDKTIKDIYDQALQVIQVSSDGVKPLSIREVRILGLLPVVNFTIDNPLHRFLLNDIVCNQSTIVNITLSTGCSATSFPINGDMHVMRRDGRTIPMRELLLNPNQEIYSDKGQITKVLRAEEVGRKVCTRYILEDGRPLDLTPDHPVMAINEDGGIIHEIEIQEVYERDLRLYTPDRDYSQLKDIKLRNYPTELSEGEMLKPLPGFETRGVVSSTGKIWLDSVLHPIHDYAVIEPQWYSGTEHKITGYLVISIRFEGRRQQFKMHNFVGAAFLLQAGEVPLVNHKNGVKINCDASNLEMSSHSWNSGHFAQELNVREGAPYIGVNANRSHGYCYSVHSPNSGHVAKQEDRNVKYGFKTPEDAARAYDDFVREQGWHLWPHKKPLNFSTPEEQGKIRATIETGLRLANTQRIIQIEDLGEQDIMDIEVDSEDRYFLANGVKIHNCAFCKESLIGHTYSEANIKENSSGHIRTHYQIDGKTYHYDGPGGVKVAFHDLDNDMIVYGPMQIAIQAGYPILNDSLIKISNEMGGYLRRTIDD